MRHFDPVLLPRICIVAVVVAALSFTLVDPDLWGHVRFGLDVIQHQTLPSVDEYSFTSDRPWVNHEWLAETLMAGAYAVAGGWGLSILKLALLLAAFCSIRNELASRAAGGIGPDLLLALCVGGCLAITRTLRPQTFSVVLFVCLLASLRRAEERDGSWLWATPPLMLLWANLHGGWLVGLITLGIWTTVRTAQPKGPGRAVWIGAGLASVAATLVTPEHVGLWRFLWSTVGLARPNIVEWLPLNQIPLIETLPWVGAVAVAVLAIARSGPRFSPNLVVVVVLMYLSFRVVRLVPFFVMAVIVLLGPDLIAHRRSQRVIPATLPTPSTAALALVGLMTLAIIATSVVVVGANLSCIRMTGAGGPDQSASEFIQQAGLKGRMLTWFDWGEYAIWFLAPQLRVSIDGRRETVYSDAVLEQHDAIYRGTPGWQESLQRLNPDHVWFPSYVPTIGAIESLGWRRVYETDRSVVLSRKPVELSSEVSGTPDRCFPGRLMRADP